MTASDIVNLAVTVGLTQLACDLLAKFLIYNKEPYKRAVGALERAKTKLDKAEADYAKNEKHAKRYQRAKDDFSNACSSVAQRHTAPGMYTSILFVILLRVMGTEHKGKVLAVLPFVPFKLASRFTGKGLDWSGVEAADLEGTSLDMTQGVSFMFIYFLVAFSVKFFVSKAVATPPPAGADRGFMAIMESPSGQRMLKSFGVDLDEQNPK